MVAVFPTGSSALSSRRTVFPAVGLTGKQKFFDGKLFYETNFWVYFQNTIIVSSRTSRP